MKVSTRSQYGLRAMVYLAKNYRKQKNIPLKEISQQEGISFDYLEKIISKLEKTDFVKAKRGPGGGYFLALKPEKIKVGDIITVLEGTMAPVKCLIKDREKRYHCPIEAKCQTKKVWQKIQDSLDSTLDSMTLADLIQE